MLSYAVNSEIRVPAGPIIPGPKQELFMRIPANLAERRIYLYLEVLQAAQADFVFFAVVRALKNNTPVAEFEAQLSDFRLGQIVLQKSMGSSFASGGSPVGDCFVLELAQPFNAAITSVVLQPLRVNFEADTLEFHLISFSGPMLGYRAFLRCLSTQY